MTCRHCSEAHEDLVHCILCNTLKPRLGRCPGCVSSTIAKDLDTIITSSVAKSSTSPRFDLLPSRALARVAARYEKGLARYGRDNWRKGTSDNDYLLERIAHIIGHCYKLIDKLEGREKLLGSDDDAGAIAWGGLFLCEAMCEKEVRDADLCQANRPA